MKTALVLGCGFIGSHMVKRLKAEGYWVRGVDIKQSDFSESEADEFLLLDLRNHDNVFRCMKLGTSKKYSVTTQPFEIYDIFDEIYALAATMGGAGFIFTGDNDADIMHNSAQINLNVLDCATTEKIFYSSSACIYPQELQEDGKIFRTKGLKESDAYPADPDSDYGFEKLFSERLYLAYAKNKNIDIRIARFHNIYGPEGTYKGGKEKAPAAMCRKVAGAKYASKTNYPLDEIEVWGTGEQTRSFLYISDCIDAVRLLMQSDFKEPINIGSEEMVTINRLAQMAINISGKDLTIKNIDGPIGVMGRNSDNRLIEETLSWTPKISLEEGMKRLYIWVENQIQT